MPKPIKIVLSIIVALATVAGYLFQDYLGQEGPKYAVLFLGPLMIIGMWLFPEVMRKGKPQADRGPSRQGDGAESRLGR